jgi:6-pyruvoyltetrahydropterin/6-carboxytetrahydropterin synthase
MFEIGVVAQFEAAHRLRGDFGPATRMHGHTYRVEVSARGQALREDGTLCDLALLQGVAGDAVSRLHYRDLDEVEGLRGRNTTAEVVAQHLFEQIAPALRGQGLSALSVRVWESPVAYASCEGDLTGVQESTL